MLAPKKQKPPRSSKGLSRELEEERAMSALLATELEQSRKENEELKAIMHARSNTRDPLSPSLDLDAQNGFSSTRRTAPNPNWTNTVDESRFLSSMNHLSLASINVPECAAPDGEDIHRQVFEQWKDLLMDSLKLAGIDDETTMYTVFKVKAGHRLLGIFRTTRSSPDAPDPESRPFSNAMDRLRSYFGSGSDVMLMRRRLALMMQKPEETDLSFITRVGSIARLCEFDTDKEFEEIVATVAEHARSRDVRTTALKMLSRKGNFTDLVDKVRELEAIKLNEEYFNQKYGRQAPALIAAVSSSANSVGIRQYRQSVGLRGKSSQRGMLSRRSGGRAPKGKQHYMAGTSRSQEGDRCWRCFSVFHSADDCSAKEKLCHQCGVTGHLQRACPKVGPGGYRGRMKRPLDTEHPDVPAYKVAFVDKVEEPKPEEETVSVNALDE